MVAITWHNYNALSPLQYSVVCPHLDMTELEKTRASNNLTEHGENQNILVVCVNARMVPITCNIYE